MFMVDLTADICDVGVKDKSDAHAKSLLQEIICYCIHMLQDQFLDNQKGKYVIKKSLLFNIRIRKHILGCSEIDLDS